MKTEVEQQQELQATPEDMEAAKAAMLEANEVANKLLEFIKPLTKSPSQALLCVLVLAAGLIQTRQHNHPDEDTRQEVFALLDDFLESVKPTIAVVQ